MNPTTPYLKTRPADDIGEITGQLHVIFWISTGNYDVLERETHPIADFPPGARSVRSVAISS